LLPGTKQIRFNNFDDIDLISCRTAAVVIEPVQGEAGYITPLPGYLEAIRQRCTDVGALLIFDEIQTGIGRTGSWFAMQKFDITPDIVVLAKGLGGGMPIGAFASSASIMDVLKDNPILGHITTFGGHPMSCAAALATLQAIEDENLMHGVDEKEKLFRELLIHPKIKEVRGTGLMLSVQLDTFDQVQAVMHQCLQNGVITDWFLFNNTSLRISPPLTITNGEIEMACRALKNSIEECLIY
jgi:acetylornithine/succinyldiaminopimelate/putrescine aminotransferase